MFIRLPLERGRKDCGFPDTVPSRPFMESSPLFPLQDSQEDKKNLTLESQTAATVGDTVELSRDSSSISENTVNLCLVKATDVSAFKISSGRKDVPLSRFVSVPVGPGLYPGIELGQVLRFAKGIRSTAVVEIVQLGSCNELQRYEVTTRSGAVYLFTGKER